MKYQTLLLLLFLTTQATAQVEPSAGSWNTFFCGPASEYRLPRPSPAKPETEQILAIQKKLSDNDLRQIQFWNAGAPGYRWQDLIMSLWMTPKAGDKGALSFLLTATASYDATVAAWDSKYTWKRLRPFEADKRIQLLVPIPGSPSYPCEYSVVAGAASTIIGHFYPHLADSVQRMAQHIMDARVAAGVAYPGDTRAGFELGKKIAELEIERTRHFVPEVKWDGKRPDGAHVWKGNPMSPMAGHCQTVALSSGSQFRPGPPPDYTKDMEELKNFKPNFMTGANAFFFASESFWDEQLNKKIFEYNLHLNPPRAARLYALTAIGYYDGFTACWDAKYTYWGTRPDQFDPAFHPFILITPPFPGYPSGHAAISGIMAELYSAFFPLDKAYFHQKAIDAAESRFQAGIHFRTDNEVGLELGRKVGGVILKKFLPDADR